MSRQFPPAWYRCTTLLFALIATAVAPSLCAAADHRNGFDSAETSWRMRAKSSQCRLLSHRRHEHIYVRGTRSENLEFVVSRGGAQVELEHPLPPARAIDDLTASLWVRSNRKGLLLNLRVVFPHQKDPRSGKVLSTWISGERYSTAGRWQQLTCRTTEKQLQQQLRRLRSQLNNPRIDARDVYVDRVILTGTLDSGTVEVFIDELTFGPVISPNSETPLAASEQQHQQGPPVEFRLDQLLVRGRPWFPRLAAWHKEDPAALKQAGMNLVWVPDFQDDRVLREVRSQGMWAMATPPRARRSDGRILQASAAGLTPLGDETSSILFWYEGTRIPPGAQHELVAWNRQIRSADRFRRPLMADVSGLERVYSRHIAMLGVSRHSLHTSFSIRDYRDWLIQRRRMARPGTFTWTWIQTEPASATAGQRETAHKIPVVVEPEQIRLQVYAALAAGCRGIGYWKTTPLDSDAPGAVERKLAISQLNLELQLIEPWLAAGTIVGQIPFSTGQVGGPEISRRQLDFRNSPTEQRERAALLRERQNQDARRKVRETELEATVIRSDEGLLLLPVWYENGAQFVPGQMTAHDATLVVPGVDEAASAWEISTTGVRSLPRERVTGGIRLTLPRFDQTAMILFTANRTVVGRLRSAIAAMAAHSAELNISLARAKMERVKAVDSALNALSVGQPDAPQILYRCRQLLASAEVAVEKKDYHGAREAACNAMQLLRILQRAHWFDAIRHQTAPVSGPHTLCFQTLPDHWQMVASLGRSSFRSQSNLLRSGNFEDFDTLVVEGWKHMQSRQDGLDAMAELSPAAARSSRYGLRLVAAPTTGSEPPVAVEKSPVAVVTPPIAVQAGQLVHISGWMRIAAPIAGNADGLMVFDNLAGPAAALRFHERQGWQQFTLVREVHASGDLRVSFVLSGMGDVHLDDLAIVAHELPLETGSAPAGPVRPATEDEPSRSRFDFLGRLPRLPSPFRGGGRPGESDR